MDGENKQEMNIDGVNEEQINVVDDNEYVDVPNPRHPLLSIEHIMRHEIFERCSEYDRGALRGTCRLWRLFNDEFFEESNWMNNCMKRRAEMARDIFFLMSFLSTTHFQLVISLGTLQEGG